MIFIFKRNGNECTVFPRTHAHAHTRTQIGGSSSGDAVVNATLVNRVGETVGRSTVKVSPCSGEVCSAMATGSIAVKDPQLWWPWTMSSTPAYLYVFQVMSIAKSGLSHDMSNCSLFLLCRTLLK